MPATAKRIELSNADWQAVEREYCARSLSNFVERAWHVLEPSTSYVHNWHIDAICEHLEAVTHGEILRLLINVPPGTAKSLLCGVFWPAWEWGPAGLPSTRIVSASHSETYALRDARRMRMLVTSEWYQALWPMGLAKDQNSAGKFENEKLGFRHGMPVKSMTGTRGDRVLWDDPHSVEDAMSDPELARTDRIFHETLPTRLNSPEHSAIVIIMQRLAVGDVSGLILDEDLGYEHLMLPMEYEPDRKCSTSIGFTDPRTEEGELLFPERFPRLVVERDKKVLGEYATAGQLQQRPSPRGGGTFKVNNFRIMNAAPMPQDIEHSVRFWDKAGTEGGGAFSAGVLMHKLRDGRYVIADMIRGQWHAPEREKRIKQTAAIDGIDTTVWVEQEPGSGGKESAEHTIANLAGYVARAEKVTGSKEIRAESYSVQVEAGNVWIVRAPWNTAFIKEHEVFPVGKYKDQVDAASGAFNKLARPATRMIDTTAVIAAMDRTIPPIDFSAFPIYLGVRVSQAPDEPHVVIARQGVKVFAAERFDHGMPALEFASEVIRAYGEQRARCVFIEGSFEGGKVAKRLSESGLTVVETQGATAATDQNKFTDRSSENWYRLRDWVVGDVDLPIEDNTLRIELTTPEYDFDKRQRLKLETFDDLRGRMATPACSAEALSLTFSDFSGKHRKRAAQTVRKVRWA